MPDTLTPQELAAIRERVAAPSTAGDSDGIRAVMDRAWLLAHIDTLTAAVRALKVGEQVGTEYERGLHDAADYVLGILAGEPHDA